MNKFIKWIEDDNYNAEWLENYNQDIDTESWDCMNGKIDIDNLGDE